MLFAYKLIASPPAASIAALAEAVNLCTDIFRAAFNSPSPKIFTKSFLWANLFSTKVSKVTFFLNHSPLSTNSCNLPRLIPRYSFLLMFLNPNLGTRRCKRHLTTLRKPIFLEYPDRDFAPLWPLVEVPPFPDPSPLPTRFPSFCTASFSWF